jgi:ZIP family zinc transporter
MGGTVAEAIVLGAVAQVSLLLSGLFATWVTVPGRLVGWLGAFGAGALISAVAFDLTPQAEALGGAGLALWLLLGAAVFIGGDYAVDRRLGSSGADGADGADGAGGGALGIVLGAIVDGVPESLIFGISLAAGTGVSASFLAAVIVSNIPQALAPSADLAASGWSRAKLALLWGAVVVACGLAAGLGYAFGAARGSTGDRMAALAAGGVLAMLTNSLMPFAFQRGGRLAGLWTVVGFALAVLPR